MGNIPGRLFRVMYISVFRIVALLAVVVGALMQGQGYQHRRRSVFVFHLAAHSGVEFVVLLVE